MGWPGARGVLARGKAGLDTVGTLLYYALVRNQPNSPVTCRNFSRGGVAQLVERGSHKPYVGGSNPPAATIPSKRDRPGRVDSVLDFFPHKLSGV